MKFSQNVSTLVTHTTGMNLIWKCFNMNRFGWRDHKWVRFADSAVVVRSMALPLSVKCPSSPQVLRERLGVLCLLGLTATATQTTALSVARHLGVTDGNVIRGSTLPGNLLLSVSSSEDRDTVSGGVAWVGGGVARTMHVCPSY